MFVFSEVAHKMYAVDVCWQIMNNWNVFVDYTYDLRHSDDGGRFCSIEPKVGVNHGGTVLMREVLDFGKDGYIPLDEGTEPNLLGETMTASEFVEEETQDEVMRMNGM